MDDNASIIKSELNKLEEMIKNGCKKEEISEQRKKLDLMLEEYIRNMQK